MFVLKADKIIVGDGTTVYFDKAVLIQDGKIKKIDSLERLIENYESIEFQEMDGCTILPGLIDVHVHLGSLYMRADSQAMTNNLGHITLMAYKHLQDALSAGITTLRSVGEPKGLGEAIRAGYQKGFIEGPRYYTCERSITITGGHGSTGEITKIEADGPWEVRRAVRENIKNGADWIKVMSSHRSDNSEFTLEELSAITDETHRLGKKCCIHAGNKQSIEYAIEAGFDSLEHAAFLTGELAEIAISKNLVWVPTSYVYQKAVGYMGKYNKNSTQKELEENKFLEETLEGYKENLFNNFQKGITIATGTDICFPDMFITPIQKEIETLCDFGLLSLQAIQCATGNGAKLLSAENFFGNIREGLFADIIVVEGDPISNIKNLRNVRRVYKEGKLVYS